jgi:hypothetical protein
MPIYHYRVISGPRVYWIRYDIGPSYFTYDEPQIDEDDFGSDWMEGIPSIILEEFFENQNPQQNQVYTVNPDGNHPIQFIIPRVEATNNNQRQFRYIMQ